MSFRVKRHFEFFVAARKSSARDGQLVKARMSSYDVAAENDNAAVIGVVFEDVIRFGYIQERVENCRNSVDGFA